MPEIAPVKRASTVVLLRDSPRGPEVFMVRRAFTIVFMAGAHVFPGGRVDDSDEADASWCDLPTATGTHRSPEPGFAVSAARELFEEAGVLLARTPDERVVGIDDQVAHARFEAHRRAVHDKSCTLHDVVTAEGLRLALDLLVPCARWVTPPNEVRRFDTWFFLARVPEGQSAAHDDQESMASAWMTPPAAIAACIAGDINLPPPTWATLRELEPCRDVAAALRWAEAREIVARSPLLHDDGVTKEIVMPGHERHPSREAVTFETRFVWTGQRWLPDSVGR